MMDIMMLEMRSVVVGVVVDGVWSFVSEVMWHFMVDIVCNMVYIVMNVVVWGLVHIVLSFPDLFWVRDCSCGNWNINVSCLVGNWLIVGVVSDISHWLPIDMHFLVVYWLKLCLCGEIFVLWLWSVMVRSCVVMIFLDIGVWFGYIVVMAIDQMSSLIMVYMMDAMNIIVLICVVLLSVRAVFIMDSCWVINVDVFMVHIDVMRSFMMNNMLFIMWFGVVVGWVSYLVMNIVVCWSEMVLPVVMVSWCGVMSWCDVVSWCSVVWVTTVNEIL